MRDAFLSLALAWGKTNPSEKTSGKGRNLRGSKEEGPFFQDGRIDIQKTHVHSTQEQSLRKRTTVSGKQIADMSEEYGCGNMSSKYWCCQNWRRLVSQGIKGKTETPEGGRWDMHVFVAYSTARTRDCVSTARFFFMKTALRLWRKAKQLPVSLYKQCEGTCGAVWLTRPRVVWLNRYWPSAHFLAGAT